MCPVRACGTKILSKKEGDFNQEAHYGIAQMAAKPYEMGMSEVFEGQVRDVSSEGHGVVDHPRGKVFFVRGTWPGDRGRFVIESESKKYGTARLKELLEPSPHRRQVLCEHLGFEDGQCGGCPWMIASDEEQNRIKQKRVEFLIARNQLADESFRVSPLWASPQTLGYRNRAQFKTDGTKLGYVSPESKTLVDIKDCLILSEKNRQTLRTLRQQLPKESWKPSGKYLWNFLDIDEEIRAETIEANRRRPFRQGNSLQNERMQNWVQQKIQNIERNSMIELFAGSGNFTKIFVESEFKKIHCAEVNAIAVENLRQKKWPNVEGFVIDLFRPAQWKVFPPEIRESRFLFLDPPREGFQGLERFVEGLPNLEKIIYVSCEPFEWANNIRPLVKRGWALSEVQPIDQFPHTPHIELLSVLTRI